MNKFVIVCFGLWCLCGCKNPVSVITLSGQWQFAIDSTDIGLSEKWYNRTLTEKIKLPGTTDEAGYGTPNRLLPSVNKPQILHLTRKNSYIGPAWYAREISIPADWERKNIELKLERVIWQTSVWVDGQRIPGTQESLISPHYFDLTEYLSPGKHKLSIRVDNRKQHDISVNDMAHAYTNETQIMWNGILGEISLTARGAISVRDLQIYPDITQKEVRVKCLVENNAAPETGRWIIQVKEKDSGKPVANIEKEMNFPAGKTSLDINCPMGDSIRLWDEFTPALYDLSIMVQTGRSSANKGTVFGMRDIRRKKSDILLNKRKIFLRGTLECCIFPLTGRPPMDTKGWEDVFLTAREWGLNHLRFHSWCPPEAAFQVADSLGFYLQVELPLWPSRVGEEENKNAFLYQEAERILSEYGNHPSFCFMSLGNELPESFNYLSDLLKFVKEKDQRRLYTTTSFSFERGHGDQPEPDDDFLITQWTKKGWVRGQGVFDKESPAFDKDYSVSMEEMTIPVITHEIGQYAVYPDLKEIDKYTGVLEPLNLKGVKQELEKKGLTDKAGDYLMASGKLAAILYKEEIERALKTPGISGFQLLDLHDFPGQGTALVGLLNAFWESKGVIAASNFRQFCAPVVPLARFPKAVYTSDELFEATLEIANFSKEPLKGIVSWRLAEENGTIVSEGKFHDKRIEKGKGNKIGDISCHLSGIAQAGVFTFSVAIDQTNYQNSWKIWVYPASLDIEPGNVVITDQFEIAERALQEGKNVLFNPAYENCNGLQGKFVPVFWSPVHFPKQAGTMGLLLNSGHKAFSHFPTENHTDWQWWRLTTQSKVIIADSIYQGITPLIECVDNFVNNRRLTTLFEANSEQGKLIVCTMDLLNEQDKYPEKRQLLYSLTEYMKSDKFNPVNRIPIEKIRTLLVTK